MKRQDMPQVGFGLWKIDRNLCASVVEQAIDIGYRHFDSACDYGNEKEVGDGLQSSFKKGTCSRENIWLTSKLWNTYHKPEHVRPALMRTLADLKTDYLDLYLIHFPIALEYVPFETRYPPEWIHDPASKNPRMKPFPVPLHETWHAMEELVNEGLVRHIGVCNYNSALIHDLISYARIKPANLQIELHPYLTQENMLKLCKQYDISVTGFSPLGALSYVPIGMAQTKDSVLEQPVIKAAAKRLGKSPAQVVLRWGIQRGCAVIPKTVTPARMKENLSLFDFSLNDQEMTDISALNAGIRFNDPGVFCEKAFNTFYPIYD